MRRYFSGNVIESYAAQNEASAVAVVRKCTARRANDNRSDDAAVSDGIASNSLHGIQASCIIISINRQPRGHQGPPSTSGSRNVS